MKETKPTKNYNDLPDTIGVAEYMAWRGVGRSTADAVFHAKDFPRIQNTGTKLIAEKRAVLLHEMRLTPEEKEKVLLELARKIV